MTDFFSKPEPQPMQSTTPEPNTVKLGDKEYSQDELSQLVGLGETAREYEKQWNRPIKDFYPDYTRKSQQLAELERQQQQAQQQQLQQKAQDNQLSPEEARSLARQQAKDLGIPLVEDLDEILNQKMADAMAGQRLISDAENLVSQQSSKGLPSVELTDLLAYMNGNNPTGTRFGTPDMAYNDMFSKEISSWQEQQLASLKPQGMVTNDLSQAGGNSLPPATSITTREALTKAINESLTRSRG